MRERPAQRAAAISCAAVAALAFSTYANSLANGFVWDDSIILTRQLVLFGSAADVVLPPRGIPQYSPDYYRPLTIASYLLDRSAAAWFGAAWGAGEAFAFHLSVVLAHAAAAGLLTWLALRLLGPRPAAIAGATAAGASFAVHPIHTESVAWMAGRADVLATCFCLAALIAHRSRPVTWARTTVTGLLVAAALGAKEVGATVCLLLPLQDLLAPERVPPSPSAPAKRGRVVATAISRSASGPAFKTYAGPAAALVAYLVLRRASLGELVGAAPGEAGVLASLDRVLGAFGAYLAKLVWPAQLNAYIDTVATAAPILALSAAAGLALGAGVVASVRGRDRIPAFCLLWILLTLAPSFSIVWKIPDAPMAERYLYLPSAGFCLLVGWSVGALWDRFSAAGRRALAALAVVLAAAGAVETLRRNRVWSDDVSLWQDTSRKSLASGMPLRSLATAYQQRGEVEAARLHFERALERRNNRVGTAIIHNNLGTLAMSAGDFADAEEHYRRAVEQNASADALFNLGLAIFEKGGRSVAATSEAISYFTRARELSPLDPDPWAALSQAHAVRGEKAKAIENYQRALELGLDPVSAERLKSLLDRTGRRS
jgi:tetratricopeptide (TPR) repeat protein